MINKLRKLSSILNKNHNDKVGVVKIVINYYPTFDTAEIFINAVIQESEWKHEYKYGSVSDKFNFNTYIAQAIEDLSR